MTATKVWILQKGEHYEGGQILGVFATRELGFGQLVEEARLMADMFSRIDDAGEGPDGSVHVDAGYDWLALEPYPVTTQPEITQG